MVTQLATMAATRRVEQKRRNYTSRRPLLALRRHQSPRRDVCCHHRLTNNADVFLTLPEAATQIVVSVSRRGPRRVWLWTATPDGKQRHQSLGANIVVPQGECQRPNEWVVFCPCWANERVRICSWSLQTPSESPRRSPDEAYSFPPPQPQPPAPLTSREKQMNELNELSERTTRMLEKLTRQPPVR